MEVKPGYKRTEVGVIPEEWRTAQVAEVVDPSAPICYGVVQVGQHTESGVPIVAIKFVKEIAHAPLHRTAAMLERPYARSRLIAGDVLISIKGTIGRIGIVPENFQGNISRELARLRIKKDFCPAYVAHQLETGSTQERIMRSVVGTTRLEFSIASLRKFALPVPPTEREQRAIAEALSDVDGLLGGLDRLIAKKRDLKQAAMQQLLTPSTSSGQAGQTRLPGFHGEWEILSMRDVLVQNATYGIVTAGAFVQNGVKMLRGGDIVDGRVNTDLPTVSREKAAEYVRTILARNDVVIALVGYPGASATIPDELVGANISRAVGLLRVNGRVSANFLVCILNSPHGRRMVLAPSAGSAQQVVNLAALNKLQFSIPPLPEQTAIAAVLTDMDAELAALEQRREKTRALKQGMMQELLTGRTRLV